MDPRGATCAETTGMPSLGHTPASVWNRNTADAGGGTGQIAACLAPLVATVQDWLEQEPSLHGGAQARSPVPPPANAVPGSDDGMGMSRAKAGTSEESMCYSDTRYQIQLDFRRPRERPISSGVKSIASDSTVSTGQ